MTNLEEGNTHKFIYIVIIAFVLLAAGEYYLYRQQLHVNKMVSEGLMQLKESTKSKPVMKK